MIGHLGRLPVPLQVISDTLNRPQGFLSDGGRFRIMPQRLVQDVLDLPNSFRLADTARQWLRVRGQDP